MKLNKYLDLGKQFVNGKVSMDELVVKTRLSKSAIARVLTGDLQDEEKYEKIKAVLEEETH